MRLGRGADGYDEFRAAMLDGRLLPGQMITQTELCALLGLSLSPLRDTLTLLEADGLITVRKRAGIRIFEPDLDFIRQNFQFRTLIEREALPAFVDTVSDDWITQMRDRHSELLDAINARVAVYEAEMRMRDLDRFFHGAIVAALRNPRIEAAHQDMTENIKLGRILNRDVASPMRLRDALGEHQAILDALSERVQHKALAALETHFGQSIHRVFR